MWQWLVLWALAFFGALPDDWEARLEAAYDQILVVYDADGREHYLIPDHLSGRSKEPPPIAPYTLKKLQALADALAPDYGWRPPAEGLAHIWGFYRVAGVVRAAFAPPYIPEPG